MFNPPFLASHPHGQLLQDEELSEGGQYALLRCLVLELHIYAAHPVL